MHSAHSSMKLLPVKFFRPYLLLSALLLDCRAFPTLQLSSFALGSAQGRTSLHPMSLGKRSFTVAADSSSTLTERKLQQRGLKILEVLDHYYPDPPIPLDHRNDFTFLVAVVLSAQTTDGKVNEVTKELFDLADSPEKMSKLEVATIQRIIQPVGLAPKKAVYVQGLSRKIVEDFEGKVPNTYEGLESLPGVGHKTASVIMSQLFGQNSFAVDTHVHRLALRWGLSKEERNVDKVQADLCRIFPEQSWNKAHLQMIYFGREYCSAKNHTPSECPICSWVRSDKERDTSSDALARFSPQKRAKGLVYYEDRARELQRDPSLAVFSSPRAENRVTSITANEAKEQSPSGKLDFSDSVEEEVVAKEEGKTLKKKIKKEEMKEEMFRRSSRSLRRTSTK